MKLYHCFFAIFLLAQLAACSSQAALSEKPMASGEQQLTFEQKAQQAARHIMAGREYNLFAWSKSVFRFDSVTDANVKYYYSQPTSKKYYTARNNSENRVIALDVLPWSEVTSSWALCPTPRQEGTYCFDLSTGPISRIEWAEDELTKFYYREGKKQPTTFRLNTKEEFGRLWK